MPKYPITPEVQADLDNRFTYHAPFGDQVQRYAELRAKAKELAKLMTGNCPPSHELDNALANLEHATYSANAAIARHEKQVPGA